MKKINKNAVDIVVLLAMAMQIIISFIWIILNYNTMPGFGDSVEYIKLSKDFMLDEYRPILYPLFLHIFGDVSNKVWIIFSIQEIISIASIYFGIYAVKRLLKIKMSVIYDVILVLYLSSLDMITFMNFSILTDSFATSFLVIIVSITMICFSDEKTNFLWYLGLLGAVVIESLLRSDRLYSCIAFLILSAVCFGFYKKKIEIKKIISIVAICIVSFVVVKMVNNKTQVVGRNGRIQTNMQFILLDRIVWPNMEKNYDYFPDEIKNNITLDEAKYFDKHNNNVMYQLAPLLEERVGHEKACEMYVTMAKIVWKNDTKKVIFDIVTDIFEMFFTPFSSLLNSKGLVEKGDSWNVKCVSAKTPILTKIYQIYSLLLLIIMNIFIIIKEILHKNNVQNDKAKVFIPYICISSILTLWFCLGDGAPPNDRYALIIYIMWGLLNCIYVMEIKNANEADKLTS